MSEITRREFGMYTVASIMLPSMSRSVHAQTTPFGEQSALFWQLGSLTEEPTDKSFHMVSGISADGSTAVGQTELNGKAVSFVWSKELGMRPLSEDESIAWAISAGGDTIVGRTHDPHSSNSSYATAWKIAEGMSFDAIQEDWSSINIIKDIYSYSDANEKDHFGEFNTVSPDGLVYSGQTESPQGRHAFWVDVSKNPIAESFAPDLLTSKGGESAVYAITDSINLNGTKARYAATGTFSEIGGGAHCLAILEADAIGCNSMPHLSQFQNSIDCALAFVEGNKLRVVGGSVATYSQSSYVPVLRYISNVVGDVEGQKPVVLGSLPGGDQAGIANAISGDGRIVVGNASIGVYDRKEWRPFIWDEKNGLRDLQQLLIELGVDIKDWDLRSATAISYDGKTIGGWGYDPSGRPEPWIAILQN